MTIVTREQAFAAARRELDRARRRRDSLRAAGRLDPATELILRRLERQRTTPAAVERAA